MTEPAGEFLLYETEDGRTRVECRFVDDTLWLTQALMGELFQVKVPTINKHLKTLYADGELFPEATIRKFLIVRHEGSRQVNRSLDHYNLDVLPNAGRVSKKQADAHAEEEYVRFAARTVGMPGDKMAPPADPPVLSTPAVEPTCSRCGSAMVKRIAKQGSNADRAFWGCSAFPKCRGVRAVD
jgi:hypothetical protein